VVVEVVEVMLPDDPQPAIAATASRQAMAAKAPGPGLLGLLSGFVDRGVITERPG
jgi:hypothetical protein